MMNKRAKPKTNKTQKASAPPKPDQKREDEKDDAMDFGGIPNRNLKKNLGCG